MEMVNAEEIEKGDTIVASGGTKFKVGKIQKDNIGRLEMYNVRGRHMISAGKKAKVMWVK